jgi:hypothetical protein
MLSGYSVCDMIRTMMGKKAKANKRWILAMVEGYCASVYVATCN